jgi:hypothetical protein
VKASQRPGAAANAQEAKSVRRNFPNLKKVLNSDSRDFSVSEPIQRLKR